MKRAVLLITCCLLIMTATSSFGANVSIRIEEHGNVNFNTPTTLRSFSEISAAALTKDSQIIVNHLLIGPERGDTCTHPCSNTISASNPIADARQLGSFRLEDFSATSFARFAKTDGVNIEKLELKGVRITNTTTSTRYLRIVAETPVGVYVKDDPGAYSYSVSLLGSFRTGSSAAASCTAATTTGSFCIKVTMTANVAVPSNDTSDPPNTVNTTGSPASVIISSANIASFNASIAQTDGEGPPFATPGIRCDGCNATIRTEYLMVFSPGAVLTLSSSGSAGMAPVDSAFLLITDFQLEEFFNKWVLFSGQGTELLNVVPESATFSQGNSGGGSTVRWTWRQQRPVFSPLAAGEVALESTLTDAADSNDTAGLFFFTPASVQLRNLQDIVFTYGFGAGGGLADGSSCLLEIGLMPLGGAGLQETIRVPLDFDFEKPSEKVGCAAAAAALSGKNLLDELAGKHNPPAIDESGLTTFQKALRDNRNDLVLYVALRLLPSAVPQSDQQINVSAATVDYGQGGFCLSAPCTSAVLVVSGYQDDCNLFEDGVSARGIRASDGGVVEIPGTFTEANGCKYDIKFPKTMLGLTGPDTITAQFLLNGVFIPDSALDIYSNP